MKRKYQKKGVSLIEVLVASFIITIAICGVVMSLVWSLRISSANAVRYSAQSIIRSKLDQVNNCANLAAVNNLLAGAQTTFRDTSSFTGATYLIKYSLESIPVNDFTQSYQGSAVPVIRALRAEVTGGGESFSTTSYLLNSFK